MKKLMLGVIVASSLVGCASNAIMVKADDVAAQPVLPVSVDGKFGGFGDEGSFKVADLYSGRFTRDSSKSSWFGVVGSSKGGMVAQLDSKDGQHWKIECSGKQSGLNLGGIDFSGSDPFKCDITKDGTSVGSYQITAKRSLMGASEETGFVTLNGTKIELAAVKKAQGSAFEAGEPLGYAFTIDGKEVADTQTNGSISIQMLPDLTQAQRDTIVVGSIASALSWRPENS
ncbi:hypothetical protein A9264_03085 [Vibrio sp. UCD-FRSSP16_10]|uniref:hypothetical protein n=1 Tax=unclassified Vibrio TaxID=2614977 RepID=UPI0007FF6A9A|nr:MULTISPECIES: hypothetical protein [unclassified Vibrio]OBT12138.1 hypothetical protein A9260_04535 [Vibrio sp. UCD-FRSSP16_30]OBT20469.1 hypothetical protein A9264_03085 [Vibrio sp. UCD-FRSSP16_10]